MYEIQKLAERFLSDISLFKALTPIKLLKLYTEFDNNDKRMLFDYTNEEKEYLIMYALPLLNEMNKMKLVLEKAISNSLIKLQQYNDDCVQSNVVANELINKLTKR